VSMTNSTDRVEIITSVQRSSPKTLTVSGRSGATTSVRWGFSKGRGKMRLVVVALMLLIAGATHAAAQQYQLFPASVAATNLKVEHQAVLVNTATGDIYTCLGTLALEKNGPRLSGLECQKGEIKAGSAPKGTVVLTIGAHIPPGPFTGVWHVDQANGDLSLCAKIPRGNWWYCGVAHLPH
jgi:hypothetical protein